MEIISIPNMQHALFPALWEIYQDSFPVTEKQTKEGQAKLFEQSRYHFTGWVEDGAPLGFIAWWKYDAFSYLEHFAITKAKRSGGMGTRILTSWMKHYPHPLMLLEIDPVQDALSERRLRFYEKCGFTKTDIVHHQPPYSEGMKEIPLWILSSPGGIPEATYQAFSKAQRYEMLAHLNLP